MNENGKNNDYTNPCCKIPCECCCEPCECCCEPCCAPDTCCGKIHKTRCRAAIFWISIILFINLLGYLSDNLSAWWSTELKFVQGDKSRENKITLVMGCYRIKSHFWPSLIRKKLKIIHVGGIFSNELNKEHRNFYKIV